MIEFFRGPKKSYDLKEHGQGIYFATDTKEVLMDGGVYTGPKQEKCKQQWVDVVGTIEEAFSKGGMVALTEDKTIYESLVVEPGVSAVLDLGDYSITNSNTLSNKSFAITVSEGAHLTIMGNGTVNGGSGSASNMAIRIEGGYCEIKSGNFTVGPDIDGLGNSCVEVNNGILEISGGTFSTEKDYNGKYFVLNKKDGSDSVISVTGGTFINYDPSNSNTENPEQNFVANGYKAIKIEGTNNYKVVKV